MDKERNTVRPEGGELDENKKMPEGTCQEKDGFNG